MKAPLTTSRKKARLLNALNQAGDLTNAPQVTAFTVIRELATEIAAQQQSIETLVTETAQVLEHSATGLSQILTQVSQLADQVNHQSKALEVSVNTQTSWLKQLTGDQGRAFSAYDQALAKVVDRLSDVLRTSDKKPQFLRVVYDDDGELEGVEVE